MKRDEDRFPLLPQADAIVPVGRQAAGQPMRSRALKIEFDSALHVAQNRSFALVSIWQYLVIESQIAGFFYVGWNRIEEP